MVWSKHCPARGGFCHWGVLLPWRANLKKFFGGWYMLSKIMIISSIHFPAMITSIHCYGFWMLFWLIFRAKSIEVCRQTGFSAKAWSLSISVQVNGVDIEFSLSLITSGCCLQTNLAICCSSEGKRSNLNNK